MNRLSSNLSVVAALLVLSLAACNDGSRGGTLPIESDLVRSGTPSRSQPARSTIALLPVRSTSRATGFRLLRRKVVR